MGQAMRRLGHSEQLVKTGRSRILTASGGGLLLALSFHLAAVLITYVLVLSVGLQEHRLEVLATLLLARLAVFQEGIPALLFRTIGIPTAAALAVPVLSRLALYSL